MKIAILDLENNWREFDLSEVSKVFTDDDIIYFGGEPCILSSACRPPLPPPPRTYTIEEARRLGLSMWDVEIEL